MRRHNLYEAPLAKFGRVDEVSHLVEKREWNKKLRRKAENKSLPWDSRTVKDFSKEFLVKGSDLFEKAMPPLYEDTSSAVVHGSQSPTSLSYEWPHLNQTLPKPSRGNNKISPWNPTHVCTEYTRNGTYLQKFEKQELLKRVDACLHAYKEALDSSKHRPSSADGGAGLSVLSISEQVSLDVGRGISKLNKDMAARNFLYDKFNVVKDNVSSFTSLDLEEACFRGNTSAVKLLLATGTCSLDSEADDPLFNRMVDRAVAMDIQAESLAVGASESPDRRNVQNILVQLAKYGANVNAHSEATRMAPLHRAAIAGDVKLFLWLLSCGANIDLKSKKDQLTSVQLAARQGHVFLVAEAVRGEGMRVVNAVDHRGWNSLHIASVHGHQHLALFLLGLGVDKREVDKQGLSAGELAKNAGFHSTAVRVLGFSYPERHVRAMLQYSTDARRREHAHESLNSSLAESSLSSSAWLNGASTGATSAMRHMMSYLYKSVKIASRKVVK